MRTQRHVIKYDGSRETWFYLIPIGDIHLGNAGCDLSGLKKMVDWVKNKENTFWIGMGDYVDCINYTDNRFDPSTIDERYLHNLGNAVPLQIQDVIDILLPIADKCIGLHRGNHEEKIRLKYHYDVMYEMWRSMKAPLLDDTALSRLSFTDGNHNSAFEIFSTHGIVGGRRGGAKINRLEDMISYVDADVYIMGHSHIKATETKSTLYLDNQGNLKCKKRVLGVTGCFLKGYTENSSSYVEKWNYPPTDMGVLKIMFNPRRHDVHISE